MEKREPDHPRDVLTSDSGLDPLFAPLFARLVEEGDLGSESVELDWGAGSESAGSTPTDALLELIASRGGRIERYRIRGEIGRGGMGVVYEVWDDELRRTLALKLVKLDGVDDERAQSLLSRFLAEARISAQLDHPGILPVIELGLDDDGNVFFTMQFVRGQTLEAVLEDARRAGSEWSRARLLGVVQRVCEAVAFAHANGVIHRDLKPANVMVGRFGETYVMDWGLAKVVGTAEAPLVDETDEGIVEVDGLAPNTMLGSVLGTPAFMPPEQSRGRIHELDRRSDVYSLGCILYQVLAGFAPYGESGERRSPHAVLARSLEGPPARLDDVAADVPPDLVAICERAMAREPADRYPDVEALSEDLRAFREGRVVTTYESGAAAELRKWVSRNRTVAGISLLLLVAILVGGVTSSWLWLKSDRQLWSIRRNLVFAYEVRHEALLERAEAAYPIVPALVTDYEAWVAEARSLLADSRELADHLQEIELSPREQEDLARLEAKLAQLQDPERGSLRGRSLERGPGVARRLELATRAAALADSEAANAWGRAAASIANLDECPAYAGMQLAPQVGLVPLGRDPRSGLWEFADVRTGTIPERDPASGALEITAETGLVYVLIPGGRGVVGLQDEDSLRALMFRAGEAMSEDERKSAQRFLDSFLARERPATRLGFEPFFLSKYEVCQAQWRRWTGEVPSDWAAGEVVRAESDDEGEVLCTITELHPVERVSRRESVRVLGWFGARLPTESCWEYAARGGTGTLWWTGAEPESLLGAVNLSDRSSALAETSRPFPGWPLVTETSDDGWPAHAPVDSMAANAFGLHHVIGNVREWCHDRFVTGEDVRTGAYHERLGALSDRYVVRGGSFRGVAARARSAARFDAPEDERDGGIGLRPMREIDESPPVPDTPGAASTSR